jgi:RNA polymerase sigma-70 factor (ECF subfamily)
VIGRSAIEVADLDSFKNFIRDFVELYKGGWVAQQLRKRFHFKNPTAVEEVRQDVSLWLLQASPETFQDVKSVQAYVFRILERRQIDQFRRASRERDRIKYVGGLSELAKLSAPSSNIPEEEVFTAQLNQLMLEAQLRAIAALPPKCRQVWDLHAEQGLERSEVARILKIRLSTVANQLSKATDSILEAQRQAVSALLEGRNDKP